MDQLNKVLSICSSIVSAQPTTTKYPICTLIGRIGQSNTCNKHLIKLDHGSVIQCLKNIYQNLFNSASLTLYLNIEESLKSFITPTTTPFSNNTNIILNDNGDMEMQELHSSQQENFIKMYLDQIIPKEEKKRIEDFLNSKPQTYSTIPLNDKRFIEEINEIQKFDHFRKSNLRERYNILDCQKIKINQILPINKPSSPLSSPTLTSSNGKLMLSSNGKLTSSTPPKGFSKDECNYGLELVREGISRIKKQIEFGIRMDKDTLDNYRRNVKQTADQIIELHDNLFYIK
ncbi:hypothetical protein DICPUDRAFT_86934 [Dictyostelium purpureum]|uniref:Uncharacterized protein n=1 Tax=Dictyostelium purpureum TaxID=5786 RepID=F0ZEW0_DICPU|nr:uncharacterized protein DICPUDRAFT_86934 [Dictyostelium purpureum]EGC37495.1 hypothetical protein DICPUDRAFT_86934 [Dictyostelium purpureum]|eukprot:XP_003285969.1 hypothetical protein DICPUDRAFT_86934 [Dictyostelium purpureum]